MTRLATGKKATSLAKLSSTTYWIKQLNAWQEEGTFERLEEARKNAAPVKVERTSGDISVGVIEHLGGFGGRSLSVRIEGEPPLFKYVNTEVFLELNPEFGRSWIELDPERSKQGRK